MHFLRDVLSRTPVTKDSDRHVEHERLIAFYDYIERRQVSVLAPNYKLCVLSLHINLRFGLPVSGAIRNIA